MKTYLFFVSLFSTVLFATLNVQALPIKNFFTVTESELVLRGAQPLGKAEILRDAGIEQVLIFKNDTKGEVEKEITQLLEAGFSESNIHHIPMAWKGVDVETACEQTIDGLKIIAEAEASGESIFFHCTVGEDRTGMLAGLYKMISEGASQDEVFQSELCDRGYADGNRNKPGHVVAEIEKGLTPLFMALAARIESKQIGPEALSKKLCKGLKINWEQIPSCR